MRSRLRRCTNGLDDDVWELYKVDEDWTQSNDVAAEHPDKLAELQRLFLIQAARFNVLPLDIRSAERFNPDIAGRPQLLKGTTQTLYNGMKRLNENAVLATKNKSYTVTADVTVPDGGANGVIFAQGGSTGGWSLFTKDGILKYCYNVLGIESFTVAADSALPSGQQEIRAHFAYDGGGVAKGGTVTLFSGDAQIGEGRVERTIPFMFSMDETADVGSDAASPVSPEYGPADSAFTGTIDWVRIDLGDDDHSHHITDEHKLAVAMMRQ